MPRTLGGTSRGSGRRPEDSTSSRPRHPTLLQGVAFVTILYAVAIVLIQHSQLNSAGAPDVASIIANTKDAFVGGGGGSSSSSLVSRRAATGDEGVRGRLLPGWGGGESDDDDDAGSIIPVDLTVNFLKVIERAPGAPPEPPLAPSASAARANEDFLPVVVPSDITFRWAHRARAGSESGDAISIVAYRIIVRTSSLDGRGSVAWDSERTAVTEEGGVPDSVEWGASAPPEMGQILEWRVQVWDAKDATSSSSWSKFAVGPENDGDWEGKWIVHPSDMDTFDKKKNGGSSDECGLWKARRPLPLFRAQIASSDLVEAGDTISSALLVITGLGSFRASVDGVPLSTSGPIDPAFTDYSKRVSYRGFDVTPFLTGGGESHVIGVTLGSGWWDHRPVRGMAKPELLPRGPLTVIAQVVINYSSGRTRVVGQTGEAAASKWQVSRGHIRESDLFTGEMVDLSVLGDMVGWDTSSGWGDESPATAGMNPYEEINQWVRPATYHTEVTIEERVQQMSLKSKALEQSKAKEFPKRNNFAAPIGKLVPSELPPVMAMERIAPDEIHHLGGGRWLLDYGKAFSGMLHFDNGVPMPIVPDEKKYPRAHGFKAASEQGDSFITVIYGESLEMTTGDINRVLVAGMGLHDGGPRHISHNEGATRGAYCFPDDHDDMLSQKDVYIVSKVSEGNGAARFSEARQSHFTTHSFRFAEVCCSAEPPKNAHALLYRTAVTEWGKFDSSNVLINGQYELVRNAMASNMLSVQSDCPHREKLPYGGDLVADSPAAMHHYDMSAFYKKTVHDWMDSQWENGAYTETSVWQNLNDYAGIGHGAGETVWATAPPVLTVRHMQHYGDITLLRESLDSHVKWIDFLDRYFDEGMLQKGYDKELEDYNGGKSGLGDWLAMRSRDTFLTHTAFYMAAARCVAYVARKIDMPDLEEKGLAVANKIQDRIVHLYLKNGKDNFDFPKGHEWHTPGPEMSLFSRIVPGEKRCVVLKNWFQRSGCTWEGSEETLFLNHVDESYKQEMVQTGELTEGRKIMGWSQWQGLNEGIFAIRYALKTLSEMGLHHIALRKVSGIGFGTAAYMMSHNATTMWESWWRSEDLYSRNHPMLGAVNEWIASSAAGVSHYPTTTGARRMLFSLQYPKSATTLEYAGATQGTMRGDYSIAWRFEDLPDDESQYNSAAVQVRVRIVVPPGGAGVARPPIFPSSKATATLRQAITIPDLVNANSAADEECRQRRKSRMGFPYSWEYDRGNERWNKKVSGKSIGTPCQSHLFHSQLDDTKWGKAMDITNTFSQRTDVPLAPGFHEILINNWQLEKEVEGTGRLGNIPEYFNSDDLGPYCKDSNTYEWNIDDATHII